MEWSSLHQQSEFAAQYKPYTGKLGETLLQVRTEGRHPLTFVDYAKRIVEVQHSPEVLQAWLKEYIDTADAVVRHNKGDAKILRGNPDLWDLVAQRKVVNGVIELSSKEYASLGGLHLSAIRVAEWRRRKLTKAEAKENEMLHYLARNDFSALDTFLDIAERSSTWEGIRIQFPTPRAKPYLQFWGFSSYCRSLGCPLLDDVGARLMGVREKDVPWDFASVWLESVEEMNSNL